jgi:hypothetical protein
VVYDVTPKLINTTGGIVITIQGYNLKTPNTQPIVSAALLLLPCRVFLTHSLHLCLRPAKSLNVQARSLSEVSLCLQIELRLPGATPPYPVCGGPGGSDTQITCTMPAGVGKPQVSSCCCRVCAVSFPADLIPFACLHVRACAVRGAGGRQAQHAAAALARRRVLFGQPALLHDQVHGHERARGRRVRDHDPASRVPDLALCASCRHWAVVSPGLERSA